ncbi:hypothetical protein J2S02_002817 [Metabacillus niabensis]|uniref:N-acetyltransferase domain-containing protein n=1 Tax=Metabacillus niabensis TaxID=324854 RepID=A0ABT9Z2M3_9BACI|nr:hypothetical protein [Metabacillus niabensis]
MEISNKEFNVKDQQYVIRSAAMNDAKQLSEVRVQIDGETEYLDRESGEGLIDEEGFKQLIIKDSEASNHLFFSCRSKRRNRWVFSM